MVIEFQAQDERNLDKLPPPVFRYLRRTLAASSRIILRAHFTQRGSLKADPRSGRWLPFTARQLVTPSDPSFEWVAHARLARFVSVRIRDRYCGGLGSGEVTLFSLIPLARARGAPELNAGALHRYLAEAVWYPTALLPHPGLTWTGIDDRRALATLTDAGVSVSLEFRFGADDMVTGIYSAGRYRQVGRGFELTPWEGHFVGYSARSGLWIPAKGEVGWYIGGGWQPVWRGEVTDTQYEF
jgi:hypothetical protein